MEKITILAKYSDFTNIFLFNSIVKLLKYSKIINYFIQQVNNK